jgi:polyphosphate kinase
VKRARPYDFVDPALYINRELSLLEFQRRVLEMAKDPGVPLLERLRFLTITSTNLDEFFEIRVAGLKEQAALGLPEVGPDGLAPAEALARVGRAARALVTEQYRVLNDDLTPALAAQGIRILKPEDWSRRQETWVRRHFAAAVLPVLTPVGIDPAHPFPRVANKSLNLVATLQGRDAFGRSSGVGVVTVPRSLPRVVRLPAAVADGPHDFVLLSSILQACVQDLFPGMEVLGCQPFRLTRNSELWVEEEEVDDLARALRGELSSRRYGEAVRLEVGAGCPPDTTAFLLEKTGLEDADLYAVDGPVNLHRLVALHEQVDRPDLKYRPLVPGVARRARGEQDLFARLRRRDILLHHPYESFSPVLDFLRQAAADPEVLAIKQTLYRTGIDSPVVEALVDAARAGKEVTAVIELRARFDEAANIDLASRLQEAGAAVSYGVVGYKAHAKMLLVVRREGGRLRRYLHLSTGNYHTRTARAYTDIGLLTADRDLGEDAHRVFLQLTSLGGASRLRKLLQSPFTLHERLLALVEAEAKAGRAGRPCGIRAKVNGLTEPTLIRALYRASQAGVPVDLLVRGVCCLRPGVPGVSEGIRVRSVVGRFLEHSRVYHFRAGGRDLVYASSADWMQRNLFGRVETCFPIEDPKAKARVLSEALDAYLADNQDAWVLQPDGSWRRARPGRRSPYRAQQDLLERLSG